VFRTAFPDAGSTGKCGGKPGGPPVSPEMRSTMLAGGSMSLAGALKALFFDKTTG
jgi:hypothetical protein